MKKIILSFSVFLILFGFGCANNRVEGDWYLNFDTSEEWRMATRSSGTFYTNLHQEISRELNEVVLQNTHQLILLEGLENIAEDDERDFITENFTIIEISRLDERRLLPREAEYIGSNIHRHQTCGTEERPCRENRFEFDYYYELNDNKFRFVIISDNPDQDEVERIIKSSREVTVID